MWVWTRCGLGRGFALVVLCAATSPTEFVPAPISGPAVAGAAVPSPRLFRGFIPNQGQWETEARFVADFGDLLVRAEPGAIIVQKEERLEDHTRVAVVRLAFDGAEAALPYGGEQAPGDFHYFLGNDPSRWRRHVPAYGDVVYPDVWPGTNIRLHRREGRFEYDLSLAPSASVDDIAVRCEGVDALSIEDDGSLRLDTLLGPLVQRAPTAWQVTASGQTLPATCSFRLIDERRFGLTVPDREPGSALVLDPGLTWATFLGGSFADYAQKVQVLASGDLLIVGRGDSPDFPTTTGVYDTALAGVDATVTRMEPTGSALVFSTFIGGSGLEVPRSLAVSSDGSIAIAGYTTSMDYPVLANAYDQTFNGIQDAFASVLKPDGSDLVFSTLIGGTCGDNFYGVTFSSSGLIVAAGGTCSPEFPVTPSAFDTSMGGGADGVVTWFDPAQSGPAQLVCSTFLGGTGGDGIIDLAMAPGDEPIVVGQTQMPIGLLSDFPTTPRAYDETPGGHFITRLAADGSALIASTHFKGGAPFCVAVDGESILMSGGASLTLPVSPNAFDATWNGQGDGFVARLDGQLTQVLAATYIGGSMNDGPLGLVVDPAGGIIIVGVTQSENYPTTPGAYDTVKGGGSSATSMVSYLSADLSQLLYSSFLGPAGSLISEANDVAAVGVADVVIVGEGAQSGFPVTPGAFDETFNGGTLGGADGYVARMLLGPSPWGYLGGAIAGSSGTPSLAGSGDLVGGQSVTLTLTAAKALTPVTLIIGLSTLNAPFKGGMLVPNPILLIFGLPTNAHGTLMLSSTWPSGLPSGFTFYTQYWIPDSAGPAGLAASNGLSGKTP
jgi:hypothetical protein